MKLEVIAILFLSFAFYFLIQADIVHPVGTNEETVIVPAEVIEIKFIPGSQLSTLTEKMWEHKYIFLDINKRRQEGVFYSHQKEFELHEIITVQFLSNFSFISQPLKLTQEALSK